MHERRQGRAAPPEAAGERETMLNSLGGWSARMSRRELVLVAVVVVMLTLTLMRSPDMRAEHGPGATALPAEDLAASGDNAPESAASRAGAIAAWDTSQSDLGEWQQHSQHVTYAPEDGEWRRPPATPPGAELSAWATLPPPPKPPTPPPPPPRPLAWTPSHPSRFRGVEVRTLLRKLTGEGSLKGAAEYAAIIGLKDDDNTGPVRTIYAVRGHVNTPGPLKNCDDVDCIVCHRAPDTQSPAGRACWLTPIQRSLFD